MNINMMPYHWSRHLTLGLATAAATLLWWWVFVTIDVVLMPKAHLLIRQQFEGAWLLSGFAAAATFVSVYGESTLRREGIHWRLIWSVPTAFVAWLLTMSMSATLSRAFFRASSMHRACWLGLGSTKSLASLFIA